MDNDIMSNPTVSRTSAGFIIAFILLLIGNILSFLTTQKIGEQSNSITHTNQIIDGLENVLSYSARAEASFHSYLIDSRESHLLKYEINKNRADSSVAEVKKLVRNNPDQLKNIDSVAVQLTYIFDLLDKSLASYKKDPVISDGIKQWTRTISASVNDLEVLTQRMQFKEEAFGNNRTQNISRYGNVIKTISVITTLIAILLTIYFILVFSKENRAKREADKQAKVFQKELERRVKELADMNTELIELRSLEKFTATGRVARTIAHEVRNPLTNINLAVEQLKTEFEGTETADTLLEMVERNSLRINNLVSNLLNATRLTEINKKSESINTILDDALAEASDRIQLNHIHIIRDYDPNICTVSVDVDKIKIAMLNLIVNGIEAMGNGGTLTITTLEENGKCVVQIKDTGVGMSKEQLNQLFEPFFTTKKNGNGLGLANSHNIIISHNGSIKCLSEEGIGTTFTIALDFG